MQIILRRYAWPIYPLFFAPLNALNKSSLTGFKVPGTILTRREITFLVAICSQDPS